MVRFDLSQYETVESRIKRLYELHEDARIITEWVNQYDEVADKRTWVVKSTIYLSAGDQANGLAKATGYAFEIDGTGGANQTSALENAETSSIGRCLANMSLSGNKRASREEMQKVMAADEVASLLGAQRDWLADAKQMTDVEKLRWLYLEAKAAHAPANVLKEIEKLAKAK
jgi:hypothetical protein